MENGSVRWFVALAAAAATSLAAATPAWACGNEFFLEVDPKTQKVERAERLLATGRPAGALRLAAAARRLPEPRRLDPFAEGPAPAAPLAVRIEQVMALATARLEGAVDLERGRVRRRASDEQRAANLAWALEVFERAVADGDLPVHRARRAEVLAATPGGADRAREELEELALRELVPDAHAWALLSSLRQDAGDVDGRDTAARRCRETAGALGRRLCPPAPHPNRVARDRS